jgi:HlyD family secretion protein
MRKFLIALILLALLAAAGYGFYLWRQQQQAAQSAASYQTQTAGRGSLVSTIGATGQVRSQQSANLAWKTSGTVKDVLVQVGDQVQPGDRLAELEQTSLPQAIILAQADLASARRSLEDLYTNADTAAVQALQTIAQSAEAVKDAQYQLDNFTIPQNQSGLSTTEALEKMEQRLNEARLAFEPYKYLPSSDPTREDRLEDLNQAQSDYNTAVKRLEYEYTLQVAQANLEKGRKDYERWVDGPSPDDIAAVEARIAAAQAALAQAWLEAPFAGTITGVEPRFGDQVAPNTPAFRLDDLTTLLVDVAVSEVDINQISAGQDVMLTFDAIRGKEYHGKITGVDRVGASDQGVVDFIVTVELTDADEAVKPGMTAAVNIVVNELQDVLLVPNRAVRFNDGKQIVYILKDGQLVPVEIELGASSDTMSEVLQSDLQAGDLIVLNPPAEFEGGGGPPFMR